MQREFKITKWDDGVGIEVTDRVVNEFPLTVVLDGRELATLLCSPDALEELTLGFLAAEGLVADAGAVASLHINVPAGEAVVRTRGGVDAAAAARLRDNPTIITGGAAPSAADIRDMRGPASVAAGLTISAEKVADLMAEFQGRASVFKATGGTHAAALVLDGRIMAFYEDIGRHNALDKILGHGLRHGIDFGQAVVFTSGRVSSEVVLKAARMGLPVLVSKSAPTAHAVDAGRRLGVTVAGFVRGRRMNIYSSPERIRY